MDGIVYIAFSNRMNNGLEKDFYIKEAIHSAKSVKKFHPDISITLYTDKPIEYNPCFDMVGTIPIDNVRIKQDFLWDSPYDRTLYLDSDTEIIGPIDEMFGLLDRFDVAATIDMMRKDNKKSKVYPDYAAIPDGFPEFAGGVILFRKSEAMDNFFYVWRKNYKIWYSLTNMRRDQPSFRVSLWECDDLHIHTLPPEYNIRTKKYHNIVDRIIHEHGRFRK